MSLTRVRPKLSYANVTATLALVLALGGGTAIAVDKVGKNSVGSKQVKNNSLKSADLKNGKGVKGADVAADTLGGAQINESSLGKVPAAARADDAELLDGRDSTAFIGDVQLRVETVPSVTAGTTLLEDAMCQEGERVLGGGGAFVPSTGDDRVVVSAPIDATKNFITSASQEPAGWRFRATKGSGTAAFYTYVLCGR